jgi:CBS domain-containing protein
MEPLVLYCSPEDDILNVIMVMREEGVRHLPILDGTSQVVGMVSIRDLLDCLPLEPESH